MNDGDRFPLWGIALLVFVIGGAALVVLYAVREQLPYVNADFHRLLTSNLVGVLIGAALALGWNRRLGEEREEQRRRDERQHRREQARNALGALKKVVSYNRDEVETVVDSLEAHLEEDDRKPKPVFSTADPEAFAPVLTRLVETGDSLELIRKASRLRHELEEFNRMVEAQLKLYLLPSYHSLPQAAASKETKKIQDLRLDMIDKTKRFGPRVSEQAERLAKEIETVRVGLSDGS